MLFIGIDLAWGKKNTTGGVALLWNDTGLAYVVSVNEAIGDDDALLSWVNDCDRAAGYSGLIIGVDAPLLVPNVTGKRPCEAELGRRFAKFQAGAHPANRTIFNDYVRGETLVQRLSERNISHSPYLTLPKDISTRQVMEVFPHPAHIVLFGLTRTLKYKAKPGRDYEARWAAFAEYGRLLRTLAQADPPLILPSDWPLTDVSSLRGGALKRYEDGLDALTCAYIVYYYWWHGMNGGEVIGDMTDGYIVVPRVFETAS